MDSDYPVWRIIWDKAKRPLILEPPSTKQPTDVWESLALLEAEYGWVFPTVIHAHPGAGKTRDATALVNRAWEPSPEA